MRDWDWQLASYVLVAAFTASFGAVFLLAVKNRNRTTLGMGFASILVGLVLPLAALKAGKVGDGPELLARVEGLAEVGMVLCLLLYLDGLAATSHAPPDALHRLRTARSVVLGVITVIAVAGLVDPATRLNDFQARSLDPDAYGLPGFWLYTGLWLSLTAPFVYSYVILVRERLDVGEDVRAIAGVIGTPLLASTLFLPLEAGVVVLTITFASVLYGQLRYAVAQGERGVFLSRFLSPHVAEQVRTDGLSSVMEPAELALTVVACDLRGFTSYAEGVPSQAVIDLLGEYYAAVGKAVAEVDGTIKDYAGDGVLVLVGAPLPRPDHAASGLLLARRILQVVHPVLERWATTAHTLGVGVGAASGRVTVGAIGSDARLEYTAVGPAVNLASRLCSAAADGEILVDRTVAAADTGAAVPRGAITLKGLREPVDVFEVPSDPEPRAVAGEPLA